MKANFSKPKCDATACGNTCISKKYKCKSTVNGSQLVARVKAAHTPKLTDQWSSAFTKSPEDVKALLSTLPKPIYIQTSGDYDAFSSAQGIGLGKALSSDKVVDKFIFAHEYGHFVDRQLLIKAQDKSGVFEALSGGVTVNDIQLMANSHGTSLGKQLDGLADRRNIDRNAMTAAYFNTSSPASLAYDKQDSSYLSSSPALHSAFRADELQLIAKQKLAESTRLAKLQQIGPKLTADAIDNTVTDIVNSGGLAGHLIRRAQQLGMAVDSKLVRTALSESPDRIATLADQLLDSGAVARDLAGSLTNNVVGLGHTEQYYASGLPFRLRNTETFANLFALHSTGDPLAKALAEYLSPQGYAAMKNSLALGA